LREQIVESIPGAQRLFVRQVTWEAADVLSISLTRPDGSELPEWTYGAHIDLIVPPDIIRQYSLCSDPNERTEWKIAVLREPASSGGSCYIHDQLRPGMEIEAAGPRNNFALVEEDNYLFIAGGIGITPLLPMILSLADTDADWRLLYGGRRRPSMAFVDQLSALGERVSVAPEDEFGLLDLASALGEMPLNTAVYCCGPEPLIAAVEAECERSGREYPHIERFSARPSHASEVEGASLEDTEFELVLESSGQRFTIPKNKTIIEVLKENGVFVPISCTEGYCGICETQVVSGIPDHRDDYLSPTARASNQTMMVCCGRSKTPELVIKR
jgi:ferredoxin-NADP reductase